MRRFGRILHNQSGATAIEYGLLVALIALAIAGSVAAIGDTAVATFGIGTEAMK